jgi:hypothetical protein
LLPAAQAQTAVHMTVTFDESAGQNPEGIVVGRNGAIYVSVSPLGDLWRIPPGSVHPQPFGHVDGIVPGRDFGMLGLALDSHRNVYAAVQSADPAANGYPDAYQKGSEIRGLDAAAKVEGVQIFHAGTKSDGRRVLANGGRVLNVSAVAPSVEEARARAYRAVDLIDWPEGFCRRDIAWRAVGRQK